MASIHDTLGRFSSNGGFTKDFGMRNFCFYCGWKSIKSCERLRVGLGTLCLDDFLDLFFSNLGDFSKIIVYLNNHWVKPQLCTCLSCHSKPILFGLLANLGYYYFGLPFEGLFSPLFQGYYRDISPRQIRQAGFFGLISLNWSRCHDFSWNFNPWTFPAGWISFERRQSQKSKRRALKKSHRHNESAGWVASMLLLRTTVVKESFTWIIQQKHEFVWSWTLKKSGISRQL